jgi:hypothetical protein
MAIYIIRVYTNVPLLLSSPRKERKKKMKVEVSRIQMLEL